MHSGNNSLVYSSRRLQNRGLGLDLGLRLGLLIFPHPFYASSQDEEAADRMAEPESIEDRVTEAADDLGLPVRTAAVEDSASSQEIPSHPAPPDPPFDGGIGVSMEQWFTTMTCD